MMKLGERYIRQITDIKRVGQSFTGTNGKKYVTYGMWVEGYPSPILLSVVHDTVLIIGEYIDFRLAMDKKHKYRMADVCFPVYDTSAVSDVPTTVDFGEVSEEINEVMDNLSNKKEIVRQNDLFKV